MGTVRTLLMEGRGLLLVTSVPACLVAEICVYVVTEKSTVSY